METTIIGTKEGEIFCGIRLKMSRKVLKNCHIFFSLRPDPIQGNIV